MGLFERMFDFNRDGKMSTFEKAAGAAFVCSMFADDESEETVNRYEEADEVEDNTQDDFSNDFEEEFFGSGFDEDDFLEDESNEEEALLEELEDSGVNTFLWEYMDEDEKREAISEAGLDPDDYDFYQEDLV